jgi:ribonucrease Y
VFVVPKEINDLQAIKLARDIANKIESTMQYPGTIKVNVIRETRAVEFAK